jgi:hypothetical protein
MTDRLYTLGKEDMPPCIDEGSHVLRMEMVTTGLIYTCIRCRMRFSYPFAVVFDAPPQTILPP